MLERPNIQDSLILATLRNDFGLPADQVVFLPLGADVNTAVFRAESASGGAWFVKLRSGPFDETSILIPSLLHDQRVSAIIGPLSTTNGQLWTILDRYKVLVFPFVDGRNGYQMRLTDAHWIAFGQALRALHSAAIPADLRARIPRETFAPRWREAVRGFQRMAETHPFRDLVAVALADFLRQQRAIIDNLVGRAEHLAAVLRDQSEPFVLCHADIHGANILIDEHDRLFLVDWDTLILAPRERDLMFVGGGQFFDQRSPEEETRIFYQGYGAVQPDPVTLAYYRYERIVEDIAAYSEQILLSEEASIDRENGLQRLTRQFGPDGVIRLTYAVDRTPPDFYSRLS